MLFSIAADDRQVLIDAADKLTEYLGRQGMTVTAQYDGKAIISDDGHTRVAFRFPRRHRPTGHRRYRGPAAGRASAPHR